MFYQKPCHWLNKKLADLHVKFYCGKTKQAHLFQQQTDKHCWSFHPLSGQAFLQQPSSCKTARWKSCIHSLDGLGTCCPNRLQLHGRWYQHLKMSPKYNQGTITTHIKTLLIKVKEKKKRYLQYFLYLVFSSIFYLLKWSSFFFIILLVRLWHWIHTRHTSRESHNSKTFF